MGDVSFAIEARDTRGKGAARELRRQGKVPAVVYGGGRVAAHEIMIGTPAIRNLIRENKIAQMYSAIQTGQQHGMKTLDQDLQRLVKEGLVSRREAQSKAANRESIQ